MELFGPRNPVVTPLVKQLAVSPVVNLTQKTDPEESHHDSRRPCSLRSVFCISEK